MRVVALFKYEVAYVLGPGCGKLILGLYAMESLHRCNHAMGEAMRSEALTLKVMEWRGGDQRLWSDEDDVISERTTYWMPCRITGATSFQRLYQRMMGDGEEERSGLTLVQVKAQQVQALAPWWPASLITAGRKIDYNIHNNLLVRRTFVRYYNCT
jgi:hypothetical protein